MSNVDYTELFGSFSTADALAATETKKKSGFGNGELYKPSINDEKCKDQNYRSLIRFIPFFNEGKWRTTIARWECYLKDVNGENGIFVVSPKTNGKSCPIRNLSYKLYTSENAIDKANSKKINVYQQYYSLVEVVKDVQHPEYDGKVFIYQFGQKIYDKIEGAMKSSEFSDGFNPFDLYTGRLFEINMTKGDQKFGNRAVANYDSCHFIDKTSPIHFGDNQTLEQNPESQKAFLDWLLNGAPKITNYLWKDWDSATTEKVNALLATYTSGYTAPRSSVAKAQEAVNIVSESSKQTFPESFSPKPAGGDPNEFSQTQTPCQETTTTISTDDDDWINSVLNS